MRDETKTELSQRLCITIPEAARLLGVSRNTGYEMARLGQLPTIKCGQRRLLVPKAAFCRMLEGGGVDNNEKEEEIARQRQIREK
jgi:excisionase family DNA binding protein